MEDKMNEYIEYVKDTFVWALGKGLIRNKKDFAKLTGVNYTTICLLLSPKPGSRFSGKISVTKIKRWREQIEVNKDRKTPPELDSLRVDIAREILSRIIVVENGIYPDPDEAAGMAVLYADELIKHLKDGRQEHTD